jgi:hypothetical protein
MSLAYPVIILWYDDSFYVKRLGLDDGGGNVFEFEILSLNLNANNSIDDFKYQFSVDAEYEYRGVIFPE